MLSNLVRNSRNLLILGIVLAIAAFVLAFVVLTRLQSTSAAAPSGTSTITVKGTVIAVTGAPPPTSVPLPALIATRDVAPLTQFGDSSIASKYFKQVTLSPNSPPLPTGYIGGSAELSSLIALSGTQVTRIKIPKGEPLLADELMATAISGTIDFAPLLRAGEVAESVQVNPIAADNGNIQQGDHVDLLLSFNIALSKSRAASYKIINPFNRTAAPPTDATTPYGTETLTQLTLQNLRVLNVAPASVGAVAAAPGANVYTLALTHQQALFLKWVKDDKDTNGTAEPTYELAVRSGADSTDTAPVLVKNIKTISSNALTSGSIISNTLLLP